MRRLAFLGLLLTGCTTPEQWQAAGSSFRLGAYTGRIETDGSFSRTDKAISTDADSYGLTGSWAPFEYWNQKSQAEAIARAITEAQYEKAMKEKECASKPK